MNEQVAAVRRLGFSRQGQQHGQAGLANEQEQSIPEQAIFREVNTKQKHENLGKLRKF